MLKRLLLAVLILSLFLQIVTTAPGFASELIIEDQPTPPTQPSVVITAFGGGIPDFFELYNQSSAPVFLGGWHINVTVQGIDPETNQPIEHLYHIALPAGWLLSKQYHILQRDGSARDVSVYQLDDVMSNPVTAKLSLVNAESTVQFDVVPSTALSQTQWVQHKQRTNASVKMSGAFSTDYVVKTGAPVGYTDALYMPPETMPLQIIEILPNARDCSPLDTALDCSDYVKLFNPTSSPVHASQYRLRTDSGGIKSSSTNTFSLPEIIAPGEYVVIRLRDNGESLSITNTGGYVWLEDVYGVKTYQETVVSYPDASATSKKGMSWAYDERDNAWKWMSPTPYGPNYWPPEAAGKGAEATGVKALADCGPGKERNPATNRCRNIVSTTGSTLTPCKPGQERNPETNRCRSVAGVSTALKPCAPNQYRNPDTNRCKNIAVTTSLKPCKAGYERNPETNRCRKIRASSKDVATVKDVESNTKANTTGWWFVGVAVLAALGYGVYEWRHDLTQKIRKIGIMRPFK